jgi:hypothetical protein
MSAATTRNTPGISSIPTTVSAAALIVSAPVDNEIVLVAKNLCDGGPCYTSVATGSASRRKSPLLSSTHVADAFGGDSTPTRARSTFDTIMPAWWTSQPSSYELLCWLSAESSRLELRFRTFSRCHLHHVGFYCRNCRHHAVRLCSKCRIENARSHCRFCCEQGCKCDKSSGV